MLISNCESPDATEKDLPSDLIPVESDPLFGVPTRRASPFARNHIIHSENPEIYPSIEGKFCGILRKTLVGLADLYPKFHVAVGQVLRMGLIRVNYLESTFFRV